MTPHTDWEKRYLELRKGAHDTYNGGHNEEDTHDAFHHGMNVGFDIARDYFSELLAHAVAERTEAIANELRIWINTPSPKENTISYIHRGIDYITKTRHQLFDGPSAPSTLIPPTTGEKENL